MVPFYLLVTSFVCLRGLGLAGFEALRSNRTCLRFALALTFAFTGVTHFTPMRHDYVRMIPDAIPFRMELVHVTGALELLGSAGLLLPRWSRPAAIGLALLLIAVFPANVYAWSEAVPFRGQPPTSLWLRLPVQFAYLLALWFGVIRAEHDAPAEAGRVP